MIANGGAKQLKVAEVIGFDDGDELDVPGRLRVIHTPGHTDRRSAFAGTSLHDRLQDLGVTQVVLTGISTTAGVESTARAAYDLGYHVVLATDAMTDRDADAHQNSITRIFPKLGETATTDEILAKLAQTQS
jgi:nicotinamidase-related amidase